MIKHLCLILLLFIFACQSSMVKQTDNTQKEDTPAYEETFSHDLDFLKKHKDVVLLEKDSMKVLIVPSYQARVMTSSSNGMNGLSYGWINYALIDSGKYQPQINAYGGEERLWLGPEGGQFALFFKKGQAFDFKNWQTPDVLDTVMFSLVSRGPSSASFTKSFDIVNYSGTKFNVKADREISLLEKNKAEELLGMPLPDVKWVGYETKNSIENTGDKDWNKSSGVLSIWLLSMMKASPDNTIIIPYKEGGDSLINDSYFGKIPAERLRKKDGIITFKADSKNRGKIGIPPSIVKPVAGSYDAKRNVLTILQFDYNGEKEYVNSMWEIQKFPYKGDVINAYNDGPNATGSQLGAFYEIESSSPAVPLKRNQKLTHLQRIFHFEGDKAQLDNIAKKILGTSINSL